MKTYFLAFKVVPKELNEHYELVEGATVFCWVLSVSAQSAYNQAEFFVSKDDWEIEEVDTLPIETTKEHFLQRETGLEQYVKAQEEGIAIYYGAWARDGKTAAGPMTINPSYKFDLSEYLRKQKQLNKKGRCLHYNGSQQCEEIINAHSIQKKQSLDAISENGHVYKISADIGSLKKNKGRFTYKKYGINRVSTFLGFCKKHDNELFEPIDKSPLLPTDQQALLYAYRSLCRELFVKENSFNLVESQLPLIPEGNAIKKLFIDTQKGTRLGLENLRQHKLIYDKSLSEKACADIRYVLFISNQKPFIAFSGLLYPEFDFMGRHLQNLSDHRCKLDLITFSTAPVESGLGVLFSWHKSSSSACVEFMRSLATVAHEGSQLGDILFRMAVSNCENLAIAPEWWDNLPENKKEEVISKATLMTNIFSMTEQTYLMEGLEGIAPWVFESVISNMD